MHTLVIVGGLALLIPVGSFAGAFWADVDGAVLAVLLIGCELVTTPRARPSRPPSEQSPQTLDGPVVEMGT